MLELRNIRRTYQTKDTVQHALKDLTISFRSNEFVCILGASGSGKTTLLNIVGGLDHYDAGDLLVEGVSTKEYKSANWDSYRNNRVGFVFQDFNLISHQTVLVNVELALALSGISAKERKDRAIKALEDVGLGKHLHKLPSQISGGQMQRVAIARALINNPEIVLADEPTGALDSETSIQVLDLLEKIAKDRLVIMVTHNSELANKYASRIINLKDGMVVGDTNPHFIAKKVKITEEQPLRNKSMSFLTSFSLSVSNLMTKKVRALITSIAGSIGIIGIAAILALASGINLYIGDVEKDTMGAFPITIDSSGIDITSFLGGDGNPSMARQKNETDDGEITIINTMDAIFSQQNVNDVRNFKEYIEKNDEKITPYVNNIKYNYGIIPQIYLENESEGVSQVNPDNMFSQFGFGSENIVEMISGIGSFVMKNFTELPGETEVYQDQYHIVAGTWPEKKSDLVVVLSVDGSLTDRIMYTLGIKDRKILEDAFEDFSSGKNVTIGADKTDSVVYDEVLATEFKVVNSAERFVYDKSHDYWVDKSEDQDYMDKVIKEGLDLKVVGIIRANEQVKTPMLASGIYYTEELVSHLIREAASYDVVKRQIENPEVNVFTNKEFGAEAGFLTEDLFNLEDFVTINQSMLLQSFNFDISAFNLDFSGIEINLDQIQLPEFDLTAFAESINEQIVVPIEEIQKILFNLLEDFANTQPEEDLLRPQEWASSFNEYINSEEVQEQLTLDFEAFNDNAQISQGIGEIVGNYLDSYVTIVSEEIMETIQNDFLGQIEAEINNLPSKILNTIKIDENQLKNAFQLNIDENELFALISNLGKKGQANQDSNLKTLGYRSLDNPVQIDFYPKDFTTKDGVVEFIDDYNKQMIDTNQKDKVVKYTDLIAAILSSVTTIINTVTYALISFVAISLIVSSIMIGVITYVSVLERTKEIGILRAIGASKKDIRRVFNAESVIIGFVAGTIGILVTYVLSYFANIIVYDKFGIANIAHLELGSSALLILLSIVLAFVAGLIPSSAAAKKHPVEALRNK